jgi:HSP20 family molecular chaperone IbpA
MTVARKVGKKAETRVERGTDSVRSARVYTPAVDIIEHIDDIVLLADMPGVDEKSVDLTLEKSLLTIHGRVEPEVHKEHHLVFSEYGIGNYERSFNLSEKIDRERITATVKDGVLKMVLPKAEKAKTRKIPIAGQA